MRSGLLKFLLWTAILVVVCIVIFILLYSYTGVVDRALLRLVNKAVNQGIKIEYSSLQGNLLGGIRLNDAVIIFKRDTLKCRKITVNYSSGDFLKGKYHIEYLLLDEPEFILNLKEKRPPGGVPATEIPSPDTLLQSIDLTGFPEINIRKMELKNGTVKIVRGGEDWHFRDIAMESGVQITERKVEWRLRYLKGYWEEKKMALRELSFQLSGNKKRLTLNQLSVHLNDDKIYAHGEVELAPNLRFLVFADTSLITLDWLSNLIPELPFKQGQVRFYGDFIGHPKDFTGHFYLSGYLDSLRFEHIAFDYGYSNRTFSLTGFRMRSNFGRIDGMVKMAPAGENRISLDVSHLNLEKTTLTDKFTDLNGQIRLDFNTWNLRKISGRGTIRLSNVMYHRFRMDSLFLNVGADNGNWTLGNGSRLVVEKSSMFFVEGTLNRHQNLDVRLYADHYLLDTLDSRLGLGWMGGSGSLDVRVTGPLLDPDIAGRVLLDSLTVAGNSAFGVDGQFELRDVVSQRSGYFSLNLISGMVAGVLITDGTVDLKIRGSTFLIDSVSFYNQNNYVALMGKVNSLKSRLEIQLHDFRFRYENYLIYAADTLRAVYHNDSLELENFVLNATGQGEIEMRGLFNFAGNSGVAVYFKNIRILPFNQFIRWEYQLSGLMEISLMISGAMDSLQVETIVSVNNFALNSDTLGTLSANFMYGNRFLQIDKFQFQHSPDSYLSMQGSLLLPWLQSDEQNSETEPFHPVDLTVVFSHLRLADYPFVRQFNFPVTGRFGGNLQVGGTLQKPLGSYVLSGREVRFQDYYFPEIKLDGRLSPSQLLLDYGKINFMNTEIIASGVKQIRWNMREPGEIFANKNFSLFVKIRDDTLNFLNVLAPELDMLTGNIRMNARLGGTLDHPQLTTATFNVSGGTLFLNQIANPVSDIEFSSVLEGNKLKIRKGDARMLGEPEEKNFFKKLTTFLFSPFRKALFTGSQKGRVHVSGDIDFSRLEKPGLNLKVNAHQAHVNYFLENARFTFSANNLNISGRDTILVRGDVTIDQGEVELDLKESEKNLMLNPSVRETPPYIAYMLNVSIPGNFYVRSEATFNAFEMQLMGDMRIIQEPKSPMEIYGNLEVPKGKYFQFEEFSIRNGRVDFVNPKELPQLDIYAEKRKYGFRFELHVEGSLNNPVKEIRIYDSQTGEDMTHLYPETKDQIALLLFGVTFGELSSSAGLVILEKGQEVINQALISQIEREARHFIGLDEIRLESQEGLLDFRNRRLNQSPEQSSLSLGKYLTPDLYLEYKTQLASAGLPGLGDIPAPRLSWESGNQLFLEYRLNRNWSISTFYEKREYDRFKIDISWRLNF